MWLRAAPSVRLARTPDGPRGARVGREVALRAALPADSVQGKVARWLLNRPMVSTGLGRRHRISILCLRRTGGVRSCVGYALDGWLTSRLSEIAPRPAATPAANAACAIVGRSSRARRTARRPRSARAPAGTIPCASTTYSLAPAMAGDPSLTASGRGPHASASAASADCASSSSRARRAAGCPSRTSEPPSSRPRTRCAAPPSETTKGPDGPLDRCAWT